MIEVSHEKTTIDIYDGKYTVINHNGILEVLRYKEPWIPKGSKYIGDGFVLALVQELEELSTKECTWNINHSQLAETVGTIHTECQRFLMLPDRDYTFCPFCGGKIIHNHKEIKG
jgi:hypothetical protein